MSRTALIDGDELAMFSSYNRSNPDTVGNYVETKISEILERTQCDKFELFLSCSRSECFRRKILPTYKSKRDGQPYPELLAYCKSFLFFEYDAKTEEKLEADDLIGLAATKDDGKDYVVVSQDKDLKSIPCKIFNWRKPQLGIIEYSKEDAFRNYICQVMSGDSADCFGGIPGVGPKTAQHYFEKKKVNTLKNVFNLYKSLGLSKEYFIQNAVCAKILSHDEYDFNTKKIKLITNEFQ